MQAHAHDLRAEIDDLFETEDEKDAYVHGVACDWRTVVTDPATIALCEFAEKLTRAPADMGPEDVETLRAAGLSDPAIHDATQVIAYFNYINRVAEGLGVEPETFIRPWGHPEAEQNA